MQAYQEVLTEPWYYDSDGNCQQWVQGEYDEEVYLNFYNYNDEILREDFDLNDVPSVTYAHCDSCDDNYDITTYQPITQFYAGGRVWVCGKCEVWYVEEEQAVECCRDDDE